MDLRGFLLLVEASGLSVWVRESTSLFAFPGILVLHAIGMGFLVGSNIALDLRILGFASGLPLPVMERFFPIMRFGFWINAVSGVALLLAYPTKALTNPLFYLKLLLIAAGLIGTRYFRNSVMRDSRVDIRPIAAKYKVLAAASIMTWALAITIGRLLAYTYTYLDAVELGGQF